MEDRKDMQTRLVPGVGRLPYPAYRGNDPFVIHLDAVFASPEIQRIQAFLFVDQFCQALGNGLNQHNFTVESGFLV